jgi:SAM-dependent methyltransferase
MSTQEQSTAPTDAPPFVTLFQMATGYYLAQALYVAAKLGIADLLKDGPRPCTELAQLTGTHAPSLSRLLRLLVGAGVFAEKEAGHFGLTPISAYLQTDIPGSLRALVLQFAGPWHQGSWRDLLYSVQTGEIAFDHLFGMSVFPYLTQHPDEAAVFDAAMTALSTQAAAAVVAAYDFSALGTIVDVGGGHGAMLRGILQATPAARGILFDLPHVVEGAKQQIEAAGLAERCSVVGGDFFVSVPSGGDTYVLSVVIHDWDDERSLTILKNCHRAMNKAGRLLLVELVLPARIDQSPKSQIIVGSDVNMLVLAGGRERTEAEFRVLFEAAGFKLTKVIPTQGLASVVEGRRLE